MLRPIGIPNVVHLALIIYDDVTVPVARMGVVASKVEVVPAALGLESQLELRTPGLRPVMILTGVFRKPLFARLAVVGYVFPVDAIPDGTPALPALLFRPPLGLILPRTIEALSACPAVVWDVFPTVIVANRFSTLGAGLLMPMPLLGSFGRRLLSLFLRLSLADFAASNSSLHSSYLDRASSMARLHSLLFALRACPELLYTFAAARSPLSQLSLDKRNSSSASCL